MEIVIDGYVLPESLTERILAYLNESFGEYYDHRMNLQKRIFDPWLAEKFFLIYQYKVILGARPLKNLPVYEIHTGKSYLAPIMDGEHPALYLKSDLLAPIYFDLTIEEYDYVNASKVWRHELADQETVLQ